MKVQRMSVMIVVGLAGLAVAGDGPTELEAESGELRHAGHIYFNVATGERLLTPIDGVDVQQGANGGLGEEIWVIGGPATGCPGGGSTSFFFPLDNLTGTSGMDTSPVLFDWGDIATDTVVDCVQVHWITDHADTDTDSDSLADGVEGFGATWTFWDGMNGRSHQLASIAKPIVGFTFFNLPGEFPVDTGTLTFYTADIDLGGSFGSSLVFEITDTDGDLQGAAVATNIAFPVELDADSDSIPDWDIDQDGLADWAWSLDFHQPGTVDFDNADGDSDTQTGADGDLSAFATAGVAFGLPQPGEAVFDPATGTWSWVPGPGAPVTEDNFGLVQFGQYTGPFNFGGFSCDPFTPYADFAIVLYAPPSDEIECGDLAGNPDGSPDGILNFADISAFLSLFAQGDLAVDFAGSPDGSPDGILNFADVSAYLALFAAGCP